MTQPFNPENYQNLAIGGSDLGRKFLQKYPGTPVYKIRIEPGEAYIAPTENIIHDSTTLGKTKPDLAQTFLGNLLLKPGTTRKHYSL